MGALGKAPNEQGDGLSAQEHRKIIWSQYHTFGIISGAEVEGQSTMAYRTRPGSVAFQTSSSAREAIIIPVPDVVVPTIPAPTTGSRKDFVLLDQDGRIHVKQANDTSMFKLGEFTVNAGITATTAATQAADRDFAVPLSGSLGVIDRWDETLGHRVAIPNNRTRLKNGRFVLPSDRRLMFDFRHSATENGYNDPIWSTMSGNLTGATLYTLWIDGVVVAKLTFYHGKFWETRVDEVDFWVTAGSHTWALDRERWISQGTQAMTLGGGSSDVVRSYCKIVDQGATR